MSGIFKPTMPTMPEPIKPPTVDDATQAEEDFNRLRRRRGLASTFLLGKTQRGTSAADSLLGSTTSTGGAAVSTSGGSSGSASSYSSSGQIER